MAFAGKWAFVRNEKMREFATAAGAPEDKVDKMIDVPITVDCKKDGDFYTMTFTGPEKSIVQKFKSDAEFTEEIGPFGKKRQAIAKIDGDKMAIRGVNEGEAVEKREVIGDEMIFTFVKPGIPFMAKRYFKRA
uniref:Fatty acid-binding protein, liver-like n=1 Tax=Saccoglossus kowalevskii TaxID=10224 RepID=A0ABM0M2R2_SACKO|nr:PREDICTED: fatty acid-binding protein, liver-like [Saccoglossus kowalevskii]